MGVAGVVVSVLVLLLGAPAPTAQAGEIKVMSTVALAPTLDEVKATYQSTSGVDDHVGPQQQRLREGESHGLRGRAVDDQIARAATDRKTGSRLT